MAETHDHLTKAVSDALIPIAREMNDRLDADLSENDRLAVLSALIKAASKGVLLGAAEAGAQATEQGIPTMIHDRSIDADPWAEAQDEGTDGASAA